MGCLTGEIINKDRLVSVVGVVPGSPIAEGGNVKLRRGLVLVIDCAGLAGARDSDMEVNRERVLVATGGPVEHGQCLVKLGIASEDTEVVVNEIALALLTRHDRVLELEEISTLSGIRYLAKHEGSCTRYTRILLLAIVGGLDG